MSKNININLNNYEPVDEMGDYDCLKLTLQDSKDGEKYPPMLYIKKNRVHLVKSPDEKPWYNTLSIDRFGTKEEYGALVNWWFEEMRKDREYMSQINDSAKNATDTGYPLLNDIEKLKQWLLDATVSKRKSDIKGYLRVNITKNVLQWLKRGGRGRR